MVAIEQTPKKIGLWSCVAFAVGSMVGAGVFVLSGVAVHKAGPGAIISFGLAGIAILCSAIAFMIISSLAQPGELGYASVGRILGHRFWGFVTSWAFYMAALIGTAFVLNAFGVYLHDFFISGVSSLTWAILAGLLMTLLNLSQATNIGRIEDILVVIKVGILLLLIGFGLTHISNNNLHPFMPNGGNSIIATSGFLFIAYLGFSVITNIAGDVKNPKRTIPLAILISVLVVMLLYFGVVFALLTFPLPVYNEASVGSIAAHLMGPIGNVLIPFAALISTLSAANSNILGASEIMVRLAARKDVPTFAGRLWNGHPIVSVLFGAIVYITLIASRQTNTVIALANVAAIAAIGLVDIAAIRLMLQRKARLGSLLPLIGLLSSIGELFLLGIEPVIIGFGLVGIGSALYLGRKYFHDPAVHQELISDLGKYGGPVLRTLRRLERRTT